MVKEAYLQRDLEGEAVWQVLFGDCFRDLPSPTKGQAVFHSYDYVDLDPKEPLTPPEIGLVVYFDEQTGRPGIQFEAYRDGGYRGMIELAWEVNDGYRHPISGEILRVEVVEARQSSANRDWRRRAKLKCARSVYLLLEESWLPESGEPRELGLVLEHSLFEAGGGRTWLEQTRYFIHSRGLISYERDDRSGNIQGGV